MLSAIAPPSWFKILVLMRSRPVELSSTQTIWCGSKRKNRYEEGCYSSYHAKAPCSSTKILGAAYGAQRSQRFLFFAAFPWVVFNFWYQPWSYYTLGTLWLTFHITFSVGAFIVPFTGDDVDTFGNKILFFLSLVNCYVSNTVAMFSKQLIERVENEYIPLKLLHGSSSINTICAKSSL